MKRAFTLIEMMIVVALIATLMTIVLRLSSVGSDETYRNTTILRLARMENCLSGYYAAYGSYPPVRLHNSRDIYQKADAVGRQSSGEQSKNIWNWDPKSFRSGTTQEDEQKAWNQVRAACEAQPVALEAPDPKAEGLDEAFQSVVSVVQNNMASGDYRNYPKTEDDKNYYVWKNGFHSFYDNMGAKSELEPETEWRRAQVCKFGLMSFLLPRFQAMMGWPEENMFDGTGACKFDQWNANNGNVPHNPFTGEKRTWKQINEQVLKANGSGGESDSDSRKARAYLEAIPSESVTSRWLPNLENVCTPDMPDLTFFGVKINAGGTTGGGMFNISSDKSSVPPDIRCYSPHEDGRTGLYHLNRITVRDGWGTELFYYSPAPYQSYQIWSAGKNERTFPVWISRQKLESKARQCVAVWTEDDIKGMSN